LEVRLRSDHQKLTNEYRKHLIQDLESYSCIFAACHFVSIPFSGRNDWSNHLTLDHSNHDMWKSFRCPLCYQKQGENTLLLHLAKHLEEVSLLALPRDVESENASVSDGSTGWTSDSNRQGEFSIVEPTPVADEHPEFPSRKVHECGQCHQFWEDAEEQCFYHPGTAIDIEGQKCEFCETRHPDETPFLHCMLDFRTNLIYVRFSLVML
jgi:hypothetical protein